MSGGAVDCRSGLLSLVSSGLCCRLSVHRCLSTECTREQPVLCSCLASATSTVGCAEIGLQPSDADLNSTAMKDEDGYLCLLVVADQARDVGVLLCPKRQLHRSWA